MSKQSQLDQIADDIVKNSVCPKLKSGATQLVFGDGSENAKVVFIGEAPGKEEDKQGKPFVGAAGKFLNEMLESISLKRKDVYITNIVKYRPPNNRDPLPGEVAAFIPYLFKQLSAIGPKLIVTLGRHSMNVFLPGFSISQVHGQPKRIKLCLNNLSLAASRQGIDQKKSNSEFSADFPRLVILPLYHPAVALYNGSMREVLKADFQKIPKILKLI